MNKPVGRRVAGAESAESSKPRKIAHVFDRNIRERVYADGAGPGIPDWFWTQYNGDHPYIDLTRRTGGRG